MILAKREFRIFGELLLVELLMHLDLKKKETFQNPHPIGNYSL